MKKGKTYKKGYAVVIRTTCGHFHKSISEALTCATFMQEQNQADEYGVVTGLDLMVVEVESLGPYHKCG